MKKLVILLAIGLMSVNLNGQSWSVLPGGPIETPSSIEPYNGDLYMACDVFASGVYQYDGSIITKVYNSSPARDIASSPTKIYTNGSSSANGLWNSSTGGFGSWTQIGSNNGGVFRIEYFNSTVYYATSSGSETVARLVGAAWVNVPLTLTSTTGTSKTKVRSNLLYLPGRWKTGSTYYGFTTINTSNIQAAFGPTITSIQNVSDHVWHGSDLYACISGIGGGFVKQTGSTWTTIKATDNASFCESYAGKLYFSQISGGNTTVYVYDPTMALSATNPSSVAAVSPSGIVSTMTVHKNDLYIGGSFTNFTTTASGVVTATNVIKYHAPIPVSSFTTTPSTICGLGTATLNNMSTEAVSYQWYVNTTPYSTNTNTTVSVSSYVSPDPYSAGSFSVSLVAINGALRDSSYQVVTTVANPASPTITALGSTTFCAGGSVALQSSFAPNYLWDNGEITSVITVTASGTYALMATNADGCETPSSNSVVVTAVANPTANINASGPLTFCAGGSVVLTGTGGSAYNWSPGASVSPSITVTASGVYSVTVSDSGCSSVASRTVTVNPLPVPTITQVGSDLTTNSFSSFQWLLSNVAISGAILQTYTPVSDGAYRVFVTNSNGCSDTSSVFNFEATATGIKNYVKGDYTIVKRDGNVEIDLGKNGNVEIYDMSGKFVYSSNQRYHVVSLTPGVYIIRSNDFVYKINM